jgi:RecB family exonuclease
VISASALAPNCAYPRVLKAKRPPVATTVEAQERGTLFHKAVESWVTSGNLDAACDMVADLEILGWLHLLAAQWTPPRDAEVEIAWGLRPDGTYTDVDEPEPHVYRARDGGELLTAGRADLAFCWSRGVLHVIDWKTGKWPAPPAAVNLQVNAAGIALAERTGATHYVPAIYYVRDGVLDEGDTVAMGSPAHAAMLEAVRAAATLPPEPRPGDWCSRCWEKRACPAVQP